MASVADVNLKRSTEEKTMSKFAALALALLLATPAFADQLKITIDLNKDGWHLGKSNIDSPQLLESIAACVKGGGKMEVSTAPGSCMKIAGGGLRCKNVCVGAK